MNISHGIVALVIKNDKFLLLKDSRELMFDYWGPPHGRCEESDESEEETVKREVFEETNLNVSPKKKLWTTEADTKVKTVSFWLTNFVSGEVVIDNDESSEFGWFTVDEILNLKLYPGTRDFFNLVKSGSIKIYSGLEQSLLKDRNEILKKLKSLFKKESVESHIFGSLARGSQDAYSDIDIWFTFKDEEIEEILNKRLKYYSNIGEILQICEPPQNAPINGVHSSVVYKTESGYVLVDYYLCPISTSFITTESKKLFGVDLPLGILEYNPKKVNVNELYRIDFFIIFIIVALKKLLRSEDVPFNQLFEEYKNLYEKYDIPVEVIKNREHNFNSLKAIIQKVKKVANYKQLKMFIEILNFIKKIEK